MMKAFRGFPSTAATVVTRTGRRLLVLMTMGLAAHSQAAVIINEIDYDQPGADTAEFIELYNTGNTLVSLDSYSIELINGSDSSSYNSIDLSGFSLAANDYFVICSDSTLVANCDYDFTASTSWLQNGAPDGVALFDGPSLIDSVVYEGELAGYTEGMALLLADSGSVTASLSRLPDGIDTNNNGLDFDLGCITPGSANMTGTGNCSMPTVVPVPAAVWLFGSGLIGLLAIARNRHSATAAA